MSRLPVNVRIEKADGTIIPLDLMETAPDVWDSEHVIHKHDEMPYRVRADVLPARATLNIHVCDGSST